MGVLTPVNQDFQISKINFGETLQLGEVSIVFKKVISDSRCPKNVTCVSAGEAEILVAISKNYKLIEQKVLVFYAMDVANDKANIIYKSENITISGLRLFPYPETSMKIEKNDYCLELKLN